MSKEKYHVNEPNPKSNLTWKLFSASILFVFILAMSILFLKLLIFSDAEIDDSICEFVTFGPVQQPNLKKSQYWRRIESDIKNLCKFDSAVEIYTIGNFPMLNTSVNGVVNNDKPEILTNDNHDNSNELAKADPSLLISGHELSNNLLLAVDLQFGDDIWTIVWKKTVGILKMWQIDAQNVDALNISPPILMYKIVEKAVLQLVFTIIMEECYQASVRQTEIDCTDIDIVPKMKADIIKPLLKSFMTNGKCVQAEFYIDHFEQVQTNGNFDQLEHLNSSNIISFELKLCH